jgi:heme-degrading monooxygenase HmoA
MHVHILCYFKDMEDTYSWQGSASHSADKRPRRKKMMEDSIHIIL